MYKTCITLNYEPDFSFKLRQRKRCTCGVFLLIFYVLVTCGSSQPASKINPMEHDGSCLVTRVAFQTFQQMIRLSPNRILSAKMDFKGEECFSLLLRAQKIEKHQDKFGHSSHSSHSSRLFNTSGLGSLLNLTRPFTGFFSPSFL